MPDTEANKTLTALQMLRLTKRSVSVKIIREEKPHVIVNGPDDQQGYQHPPTQRYLTLACQLKAAGIH